MFKDTIYNRKNKIMIPYYNEFKYKLLYIITFLLLNH